MKIVQRVCVCLLIAGVSAPLYADELNAVLDTSNKKIIAGQKSQKEIDKISEKITGLMSEYRQLNKQIYGLKVYNSQLDSQVHKQQLQMQEIEGSIKQVTVMERQITPLIQHMIESLEKFVELDKPFHLKERRERVAFLYSNLARSDISSAEKFRQVLEAYKIENEFGRKIDQYKDKVLVDGQSREVDVLQVGRVALIYQTADGKITGSWNQEHRQWEVIDSNTYRSTVAKGLRMARKQAAIDLLKVPVITPVLVSMEMKK